MRILIAIVMVSAACSGGDKVTSLDGTKQLASLTKAESDQLCADLKSYKTKHEDKTMAKQMRCSVEGLFPDKLDKATSDDDAQKLCREHRDSCVGKADSKDDDKTIECAEVAKQMSSCNDATVADLTACIDAQFENTKTLAKSDLCTKAKKGAGIDEVATMLKEVMLPAPCKLFDDKCKKKK